MRTIRGTATLLELPPELLHEVYDRLEVDDRLALNRALPPRRRVLRTSRTTVQDDRALYAISRALKRVPAERRGQLVGARGPLRRFLLSHASDPTVRAIAAGVGVGVGVGVGNGVGNGVGVGVGKSHSKADALIAALETRDVAALRAFEPDPDLPLAVDAGMGLAGAGGDMVTLTKELLHQPDVVGAILGNAAACEVFCSAVSAAAPFGPRIRLFDLINHCRFEDVERLLAMGPDVRAAFGVRDEDVREFVSSHSVATLCCGEDGASGGMARFVLRTFGGALTDARRAALLEAAVANANVNAVEAWL